MRRIPACLFYNRLSYTICYISYRVLMCFFLLNHGSCVQRLSKMLIGAKMHALHCWKLLGFLMQLPLERKISTILETSRKVLSNFTWTVTCRTNLSDFFPVEYSSAIVHPSSRGNGGICLELRIQSRLFSTKFICLAYKLFILHPFNFVLQQQNKSV